MKELIKQLESKVKNCHNTNTIFDTRNYVLLNDVRKLIVAINDTQCCKSDSEQLLGIGGVSNRFSDPKFIDNVCISYRHDFGLLSEDEQNKVRFECKEWMRAIKNNEPY